MKSSLRSKVLAALLIVFLTLLWTLTLFAGTRLRADGERALGEQQLEAVSTVAATVNEQLALRFAALDRLAATLTPQLHNNATVQSALEHAAPTLELFNGGLVAYRADNTAVAEVPRLGRSGVDYSDRDSVVAATSEGKSSISRPIVSPQMYVPVFLMTVPVRDGHGQVIGALAGVVDLVPENFLDRILKRRTPATGGYLLLAPQHQLIVTATDKSRIMKMAHAPGLNPMLDRFLGGEQGTIISNNASGVEVLASAKNIPVAGWSLSSSLPTADAFAALRKQELTLLAGAGALTLATIALAWWWLRRRPAR